MFKFDLEFGPSKAKSSPVGSHSWVFAALFEAMVKHFWGIGGVCVHCWIFFFVIIKLKSDYSRFQQSEI
mgnify:CR=1 FL=1